MPLDDRFNIAAFAAGTSGRIQFRRAPWLPETSKTSIGAGVRKNTIVMVGIAVVFGLLAVFVAQGWLNYQAELSRRTVAPPAPKVATKTIVVATGPLRFGTHISPDNLREVAWPEEATPAGTYGSIAELTSGGKRIVLASIEKNEPILRTKITGP